MLEVPNILQDTDYNCGDAAIDAALAALGVRRPRGTKLANPIQGMACDTVAAILRAAGVCVLAGPMVTGIDGLRHYTRAGCPVLCPISERGGHWVVVGGVSQHRVHFHDPADGPTSRPRSKWLDVWHDRECETGHTFSRWGIVASVLKAA